MKSPQNSNTCLWLTVAQRRCLRRNLGTKTLRLRPWLACVCARDINKKKKTRKCWDTGSAKGWKIRWTWREKTDLSFCMLLDISTVIGPDIAAAALYRGSQKHTLRDWAVWSYSGGRERKNERGWKTNKQKKKKERACRLWKCPVAADKYSKCCCWSDSSTSGQLHRRRSAQWCSGLEGCRVTASRSGKGREGVREWRRGGGWTTEGTIDI